MKKNYILLMALFTLTATMTFAQNSEKCSAYEGRLRAIQNNPESLVKDAAFEELIVSLNADGPIEKAALYSIPVVIHIIHDGEAVGTGTNISDADALSIITVMNNQFRKMTSDSLVSGDPFYNLSVDTEIEFCLAVRDPDGNATSGITRQQGGQSSYEDYEFDSLVKPSTIWDASSYMNMWCIAFTDPSLDGYGTFPNQTSDSTDGIVVSYNDFTAANQGQKSIVGTHEVGHYLNLNHIWGDATCGDDLVADTPTHETDNFGCPTYPHNVNSNCNPGPEGEMYMNYMDYSDAVCTMVFTPGQTQRMRVTLETLRSGLLTSDGCDPVVGLNTLFSENAFTVYPNPNAGVFMVDLNQAGIENVNISVINQLGQEVKQVSNVQSFPVEITLEDMPNGIFYLQIESDQNVITTKVSVLK